MALRDQHCGIDDGVEARGAGCGGGVRGAEEVMADGEVACGEVDEGFGDEVGGDFAVRDGWR